ncbi:MAG: polysaccharide biosynthesis C-terminal domain-containing protein [Elusimicrobia bacterium]|nr:polysaccharide biosynthesis C-terminal domain-containing protein [Elusimicrobiota bacterium]
MGSPKAARSDKETMGRNVLTGLANHGFGIAVSLLTAPSIIRGLGATDYGLWNVALTIGGWAGFVSLIFSTSAVNFVGNAVGRKDDAGCLEAGRALGRLALVYAIIAGAAISLAAPVLARNVLHVEAGRAAFAERILLAQAAFIFFQVLSSLASGIVGAHQRLDVCNGTRMIGTALQGGGASLWVLAGYGLEAVVWWVVAAQAVEWALLAWFAKRLQPSAAGAPPSVDMRAWSRRLLDYGGTLFAGFLAGQLVMPASRFLLGVFRPLAEVAYLTVPTTLAGQVRMPSTHFANAILVAVSKKAGEGDREGLKELYLSGLRWSWLAVIPLTAIVTVIGGDFISAWISPEFGVHAGPLVPLLVLATAAQALGSIPAVLSHGIGQPRPWAAVCMLGGAVNLACSWWLIQSRGAYGAAASLAATSALSTGLILWWANREVGAGAADVLRALEPKVVAAALAAAWVSAAWRPALPAILAVVARGAAGAAVIAATAPLWLRKDELDYFRRLVPAGGR